MFANACLHDVHGSCGAGRIRKISTSTVVVTTWTGTRANTASDGENGAAGLGSLAGHI